MSYDRNREDQVLDEIAELVDWQLSGGDQSDSFHGLGWRDNHPCSWCGEGYHFLPITRHMQAMRLGSYATDEFGQGIVDPDYRYTEDTSPIVCPGSNFKAPPVNDREWAWCKQRWGRRQGGAKSAGAGVSFDPYFSRAGNHPNLRTWRFTGPFEPWTISLEHDRDFESDFNGRLYGPPRVISERLYVEFQYDANVVINSSEQLLNEYNDGEDIEGPMLMVSPGVWYARVKPIKFEYVAFTIYATDPTQPFPDYVEFKTFYTIEAHRWWRPYWQEIGEDGNVVQQGATETGSRNPSRAEIEEEEWR